MKPNVSSFKVYKTFQDDDFTRKLFRGREFADLREQFRHGELIGEWYKKYPMLFDDYDRNNALSQAGNDTCNAHFHEWFAAILIYHNNNF